MFKNYLYIVVCEISFHSAIAEKQVKVKRMGFGIEEKMLVTPLVIDQSICLDSTSGRLDKVFVFKGISADLQQG